ncbi:MAG TPA: hypothetical protein ENK57_03275 [Polyangiaceae bacterium]|nr:hypothetical protein [Polyangiaceae bacterium]
MSVDLQPGLRFRFDVAWNDGPLVANPTWTDVTADLIAVDVSRGRTNPTQTAPAGGGTAVFDNQDGSYNPLVSNLDLLVPAKIQLDVTTGPNAGGATVWRGFIAGWTVRWSQAGKRSIAEASLVDAFAVLQLIFGGGTLYTSTTTGARANDLLDDAGWPSALRNIGALAAIQQSAHGCSPVVDALRVLEATEGSFLHVDQHGRVAFPAVTTRDSASVAATFTTNPASTNPHFVVDEVRWSDDDLWNRIEITPVDLSTVIAEDTTSQNNYALRTLRIYDTLHPSTSDAQTLANRLLDRYKAPRPYVPRLELLPAGDPEGVGVQVRDRDIETLIRVEHAGIAGGTFTQDLFIEGVQHQITADPPLWRTTWALSPYDVPQGGNF